MEVIQLYYRKSRAFHIRATLGNPVHFSSVFLHIFILSAALFLSVSLSSLPAATLLCKLLCLLTCFYYFSFFFSPFHLSSLSLSFTMLFFLLDFDLLSVLISPSYCHARTYNPSFPPPFSVFRYQFISMKAQFFFFPLIHPLFSLCFYASLLRLPVSSLLLLINLRLTKALKPKEFARSFSFLTRS